MLEEKGADRLLHDALMDRDKFERMAEHLDDHLQSKQELPDIRADLNDFCDKIEGEKPEAAKLRERCLRLLNMTHSSKTSASISS